MFFSTKLLLNQMTCPPTIAGARDTGLPRLLFLVLPWINLHPLLHHRHQGKHPQLVIPFSKVGGFLLLGYPALQAWVKNLPSSWHLTM
jgi:hypothetical protein